MEKISFRILIVNSFVLFVILIFGGVDSADGKVITQFVPTASISVEYTDNYLETETNEQDDVSTIYSAGFSFGLIGKNAEAFLNYNPEYTAHSDFDEDDSWSHLLSLIGQVQASRNTAFSFSERFVRDLTRTTRTGSLEKHDTNTTSVGMLYEFGQRDAFRLEYEYQFDDYDDPNDDEFESHTPSLFLSYWFTPTYGINFDAYYEKTEYDLSDDDPETWFGRIQFLKAINRHFDVYLSYAHTQTDQLSGDHTIYNPSAGFDWRPTDDSGIRLGIGVLFQEWDNQSADESEDLFLEMDAFKIIDFNRRTSLSVTGASGYRPTGDEAASLGFEIYYRAGTLLTYRLTRRLTSELSGSYQISEFDEPGVDRKDNTLGLGAAVIWEPLQWLSVRVSYAFTDFETDDNLRDDYQENMGMVMLRFTPSRPVRFDPENPRSVLEERLFD